MHSGLLHEAEFTSTTNGAGPSEGRYWDKMKPARPVLGIDRVEWGLSLKPTTILMNDLTPRNSALLLEARGKGLAHGNCVRMNCVRKKLWGE